MPVTFDELLRLDGQVSETDPSLTVRYLASGTDSFDDLDAAIRTGTPATESGLSRLTYRHDYLGAGFWTIEIPYGVPTAESPALGDTPLGNQTFPTGPPEIGGVGNESLPPDVGNLPSQSSDGNQSLGPEWSFDTKGGTVHITQSRGTLVSAKLGGGDPPDFKGAIGVSKDGVAGVDITAGKLRFTYTARFPFLTRNYLLTLKDLTGTTNNDEFFGFDAGELLFAGASGSCQQGPWVVQFEFEASPNLEDIVLVGDIGAPATSLIVSSKPGHAYLWVYYSETITATGAPLTAQAAYVEIVYEESDFTELGI